MQSFPAFDVATYSSTVITSSTAGVWCSLFKMKGLILSSLVLGALGYPSNNVAHEKRDATRAYLLKREPAAGNTAIPVQIALKQSNIDEGVKKLYDV